MPHDMIQRARREGGQENAKPCEDLVRININRLLHVIDRGAWMLGTAVFWLTTLAVLAFWYDIEPRRRCFCCWRQ